MSNDLTISLNEFRALLRKAFEGTYGHGRDWNALADLILWLEYRGLGGLRIFFEAESGLNIADRPKVESHLDGKITIEGQEKSLLSFCPELGDLLIAAALNSGHCVMQITNVSHAEIVVATVNRCTRNGLAAVAWWPGKGDWGMIAFQEPGETEPNLYRIELPPDFKDYSGVKIIADKSLKNIQKNFPKWFYFLKSGQQPSSEIDDLYLAHLDNGYKISTDDYRRLSESADRILVEATEQSRQGAGE